jgi:hypothetical protein
MDGQSWQDLRAEYFPKVKAPRLAKIRAAIEEAMGTYEEARLVLENAPRPSELRDRAKVLQGHAQAIIQAVEEDDTFRLALEVSGPTHIDITAIASPMWWLTYACGRLQKLAGTVPSRGRATPLAAEDAARKLLRIVTAERSDLPQARHIWFVETVFLSYGHKASYETLRKKMRLLMPKKEGI